MRYQRSTTSVFNIGYHLIWCPKYCLKTLHRDINAAINILREGASSLSLDIVRLEGSSEYCLKLESNAL